MTLNPLPLPICPAHNLSHLALGLLSKHTEDGHFSSHRLPRSGRSAQQDVAVRVIQSVENLRLNGVEVCEAVEGLQPGVLQGRDRKWLQIQQL